MGSRVVELLLHGQLIKCTYIGQVDSMLLLQSYNQQSPIRMSEQDSCYSNDEQYFLDLCRGNEFEELQEFVKLLPADSQFDWGWCNFASDNFIHMIAANNLPHILDFLMPHLLARCPRDQVLQIINKQNSSGNTPLHYAVITESKQMVGKLLTAGADPHLLNEHNRTPLAEAEKFEKYEIAELLAPVTKTDIEKLKKQIGQVQLNDDSSDEQQLPTIEEKGEEIQEQSQKQKNTQGRKQELTQQQAHLGKQKAKKQQE